MSFLDIFKGNPSARTMRHYKSLVAQVLSYEEGLKTLSLDALKDKTTEFKKRLAKGETLEDLMPEAFAVVREASRRTLGQRHYDVQIVGGAILHKKGIAEMRTGEGKTLVGTLPAYLNALTEKGVHVVTVNDFLSRRDATWMGQIYDALGLSVSVLNNQSSFLYDPAHTEKDKERDDTGSFKVVHEFLKPCTRRDAYAADITYGTNNEFGFDYLRDNLVFDQSQMVQRGHAFALVDEIDSILIDEARTPLIISSPSRESDELYHICARVAKSLRINEDYTVDEKEKAISLTEQGINRAEEMLGVGDIYTDKGVKYVHHLETAVRAQALFHKDKEYVVKNNEIVIVDEFTGRMQPGRRWSQGLHQAIEAKEGVPLQKESSTVASITFQNYFRLYDKLAGMTGTAKTSSEEFYKVYGLDVVEVPTHRPIARVDTHDLIFQTEHGKLTALAREVKKIHEKGQPVLIGTVSIEKNELIGSYLSKEGIPFEMLNAKNHEREGEIVAQAGRKGAVVVATNMAGRGVDIKLGGSPEVKEHYEEVKALGGLYVIGTERHEARRIDNQLRGRAGRQGDPGTTTFYVCLEDPLMRAFAPDSLKTMMGRFGIPEDEPIATRMVSRALETAQTRIEGFNFDRRKQILAYDDVMNEQRKSIYARRASTVRKERASLDAFLEKATDNEVFSAAVAQKKTEWGEETFYEVLRGLTLQAIDTLWTEHLESMDALRSSVGLRGYGQRDPLVEYKKEGLGMFKALERSIDAMIVEMLPNVTLKAAAPVVQSQPIQLTENRDTSDNMGTVVNNEPKIGRNDPCYCGSGKKFKKCHGA